VALSTLVPLLVLVAGFEAAFALYTNVERIGRYLQVFHERDGEVESVCSSRECASRRRRRASSAASISIGSRRWPPPHPSSRSSTEL
jgi:hypothetical protein